MTAPQELYNTKHWANKLDATLYDIKRLGLKIGLTKTENGIQLFVENTVCQHDSTFQKCLVNHTFEEIEND